MLRIDGAIQVLEELLAQDEVQAVGSVGKSAELLTPAERWAS